MKCYRVWFVDGTAILVDAENRQDAEEKALAMASSPGEVERIECLD